MEEIKKSNTKASVSTGRITGGLVPTDFDGLYRLANIVFAAKMFLPSNTYSSTEEVFVAMQMGMELKLSPMQSLHSIAMIKGRPTVWGDALLAIAQGTGKLTSFIEKFVGETGNGEFPDGLTAVCEVSRSDMSNIFTYSFSVYDAKKAGLWKIGVSDPRRKMALWYKYPKRMLQMRARSWALRAAFSDALRGFYAAEELIEASDKNVSAKPKEGTISYKKHTQKSEAEVVKKRTLKNRFESKVECVSALKVEMERMSEASAEDLDALEVYIEYLAEKRGTEGRTICYMAMESAERVKATLEAYKSWVLSQEG